MALIRLTLISIDTGFDLFDGWNFQFFQKTNKKLKKIYPESSWDNFLGKFEMLLPLWIKSRGKIELKCVNLNMYTTNLEKL